MERGLVLHQRHLRHEDHAALHTAAQECDEVVPVFVFDPAFYEGDSLACDARIRFLHECLRDLDVSLFHGKPTDVFSDFEGPVYTMHSPSGRYGQERNERLYQAGATFIDGDGLRRVEHSRDGWSDKVQEWLDSEQYIRPDNLTLMESDVTIDWIEDEYDIDPVKENVPRGGREAALDQLDQFCDSPEYWGHISEPTRERGLSGLSPYLRFGCLSLREVYQRARERLDGRDWNAFQSRLFWNLHYNQKLLDWPGWMERAVNPALRGLGTFNKELWESFKAGETGYPMVDAAVRQLTNTGWLNFRNRAMLASFVGHLLQLPWKLGADWMYYHLIDADPGINYTQWQNQTSRVGTNLFRMYNPRKQVRDSDEAADWITQWVPELRDLPAQFLDQPEKTPLGVQENCGVSIGEDYPQPIVEYESARVEMQHLLEDKEHAAQDALAQPEIEKRASLSARGGSPQPSSGPPNHDNESQASLGDFS